MSVATGFPGPCAGVDIGGTATRVLLWERGICLARRSVATASFLDATPDARVAMLARIIRGLLPDEAAPAAVGIGASGPIDLERGVIHNPYTLPAFSGFPIVAALADRLGCPVILESDAVVAAVGEHRCGAGQAAARMVMVTLGTGIGVAFLIDGQPFRGGGGAHPEGGHIPVVSGTERCYCGITGCWEQQASRTALQAGLRPFVPDDTPAERILERAAAAAPASGAIRDAFRDYGRRVGRGLCALHTLYMPDVTVLGGSAASCYDLFRDGLDQEIARSADYLPATPVRPATLDEAGAIGAALLAEEHVRGSVPLGSAARRGVRP